MFGSLFGSIKVEVPSVKIAPGTTDLTVTVTRSPRFGGHPPAIWTYQCRGSASRWQYLVHESGVWVKFPRWIQNEIDARIVEQAMRETWVRSAPTIREVGGATA